MRKVADRSRLGKLVLLSMFCSACELVMGEIPDKPQDDAGSMEQPPNATADTGVPTDARDAAAVLGDAGRWDGDATADENATGDAGLGSAAPADAGMEETPCVGAHARTVYRDADGDGHGDVATARSACGVVEAPWVATAGDCNDQDANVYPGQAAFFGAGYTPRNGAVGVSFDYDCDGDEVAGPDQNLAPTTCVGLLVCLGGGYLPNGARPPAQGVNIYCGSNVKSFCTGSGLLCQDSPSTTDTRYVCN